MKNTMKKPVNIPVSKLRPFEGHPFKVKDDAEMNTLIESVQTQGILTKAVIQDIMCEEKANQREMFKVPMERIRKYVPNANAKQAENFVLKACEHYRKYLRNRDRER